MPSEQTYIWSLKAHAKLCIRAETCYYRSTVVFLCTDFDSLAHIVCQTQQFIFLALIFMGLITVLCGNMLITSPSSFLFTICVLLLMTLAALADEGAQLFRLLARETRWLRL